MNPYFIDEPAIFSFSGGRTSGYMLYKTVEAHDGALPKDVVVTFANTGKEMPETLDFVKDCGEHFGVDIVWLELSEMTKKEGGGYDKKYRVTNHKDASRNGEPFTVLLDAMPAIPNMVNMACTAYLKTRLMRMYADDIGLERGCLTVVGLRADERRRVANLHNKKTEGFTGYCPLSVDSVTKEVVSDFWSKQNFDLNLPNNNGVTDWGNCDVCFKKGGTKRQSIIRERPDLADWWIEAEKKKGQKFRLDQPDYKKMKMIATDQGNLFDFPDDDSIPCFCGD